MQKFIQQNTSFLDYYLRFSQYLSWNAVYQKMWLRLQYYTQNFHSKIPNISDFDRYFCHRMQCLCWLFSLKVLFFHTILWIIFWVFQGQDKAICLSWSKYFLSNKLSHLCCLLHVFSAPLTHGELRKAFLCFQDWVNFLLISQNIFAPWRYMPGTV